MTTRRFAFTWDPGKRARNLRDHKVAFEDAALVFLDPLHRTRQDRIEDGEVRWQTMGTVGGVTVLLVAHLLDEDEGGTERVRIISARKATRKERRRHEQAQHDD